MGIQGRYCILLLWFGEVSLLNIIPRRNGVSEFMKVLLLQDVDNLGLAGDVVTIAPGYGRNYLLPQKLAILATPGALKQAEAIRKAGEVRRAREKADAEAIVNQIEDKVLIFERRAGERGRLYGSVTASDIAQKLSEQAEIEIDRRKINLSEPIRTLGEWDVTIRLMVEVSTTVRVIVIGEGETYTLPSTTQEADQEGETPPTTEEETVEAAESVEAT